MDNRQRYEEEIDLKDLMLHILYRWRSVVLVAVLACVLAGGYAAVYNQGIFPKEKAEIQGRLNEQKEILEDLKAQAQPEAPAPTDDQGRTAEQVQKQIDEIAKELEGVKKLGIPKYAVIGFAGGFFVLVFCYAIGYVFSDKMRGERELRERYGYYLLGAIPKNGGKKPLGGIDKALRRLEGSEQITEEEAYRIVATNIANLSREGGTFLVTGTVSIEDLEAFTVKVVPQLPENIMLMTGAYMGANAGTLEMLADCDAVILIEERDGSLRTKVQKEYETIAALEKNVIGYVLA
ncbi:MAG: hypothetical protein HFH93_02735 [Lachnospiraceae bacterium]|nr:hypothetical protein [Lachnospiraceae bacterium]